MNSFIAYAVEQGVIKFGDFTLKNGQQSSYFFDLGAFCTGKSIIGLGMYYAETIIEHKINFDCLYGPAYKGIPLVTTTASVLCLRDWGKYHDISYAYNRKEAKTHGEEGFVVGTSLEGKKVLTLDDVITEGGTIQESIQEIESLGGTPVGAVVAFDRQEMTRKPLSIEVYSLSNIEDLAEHGSFH